MKRNAFVIIFILIALFSNQSSLAQSKLKNYQLKGYVKNLQNVTINTIDVFSIQDTSVITGNTLHNRFNFKWFINDDFRFAAEFRNQLFIGEQVSINPQFAETIGNDNGLVDLSFNWIDHSSVVLNTQIDRFWLDWQKNKWSVRLGRQRINWGLNLGFNPNDLFNTYNFLDFDYEEKPGTDALKITYHKTYSTSFELAIRPDTAGQSIAALKYGFNKWKYDFQLIGGYYKSDIALGLGWAGNIKNGGFKGEFMYFTPTDSLIDSNLNLSLTYENVFGKTYFQAAALYNMRGIPKIDSLSLFNSINTVNLVNLTNLINPLNLDFSPKNLFPFRYTALLNSAFTLSPLSTATVGLVYSPGANTLILTPSFSYSIADNWDLNVFIQSFFTEIDQFEHFSSSVFLRLKWSY